MIRLSEQSPLGTGRHRKCYAHPEDAQRCIKIVYHRGDGGDKEIRRELKYYAHLGRRLKDWSADQIAHRIPPELTVFRHEKPANP